ncbi:MAG: hypothetical protein ACFWTL_06000 [Atopobium sp.]
MHAFAKLLDKGIGAFDRGGASVYESAFTNDITTIETTCLEKIETLARDIPMFLSAVVLLFVESVPLATWAIVCALLSLWVSVVSGKRLAPRQQAVSDEMGRFVAAVHDIIAGFAQIKSFKAEGPAERRFLASNTELEDAKQAKRRCEKGISVIAEAAGSISQITVLFFGAWLCVSEHAITIGGIMMVTQLMNYIRIRCKLVCSSLHGGVASASSGPCGACAPARFALRWALPRDHGALRPHVPSTRV